MDNREEEQWGEDYRERATGWGGFWTHVQKQEPNTIHSSADLMGTGVQLQGDHVCIVPTMGQLRKVPYKTLWSS